MRDLVFVGAEFEGLLSTDPSELPNGKFLVDLTKYLAGFEDSAINIERDGTSDTMTKVAYSLRFCKKPNTMFLKEGYERFISKGRTNFMRGYWNLRKVFYVGNEGAMPEQGDNDGDIALCVDGDAYMWHDDISEWRGIGGDDESIVAPNTIVYCEDGDGYTAYINATDKSVEWDELILWKKGALTLIVTTRELSFTNTTFMARTTPMPLTRVSLMRRRWLRMPMVVICSVLCQYQTMSMSYCWKRSWAIPTICV